jgi:hypothetical protein
VPSDFPSLCTSYADADMQVAIISWLQTLDSDVFLLWEQALLLVVNRCWSSYGGYEEV